MLAALMFWGLCPLSFLYGLIMRLRSKLYLAGLKSSYRAAVPVISVGNIAVGGTGKTPMADFLARYLAGRGFCCAIVSRGYGGSYRQDVGKVIAAAGIVSMSPAECGDEPYLLATRNPGLPVYIARQRMLGVQAAERDGAQVILLDDGFQHQAVQRDLDIVLLDAQRPFGNGRILPTGILREPVSALQRADLIVMTRSGSVEREHPSFDAPVVHSHHQPDSMLRTMQGAVAPESDYAGKSCLAFAGIAKPEGFFQSLRSFGFSHIEEVPLADHQEFSQDVLNHLFRSCLNYDLLITSEKDAVKLELVNFPKPCYKLGVNLVFDDISPLDDLLEEVLVKCR